MGLHEITPLPLPPHIFEAHFHGHNYFLKLSRTLELSEIYIELRKKLIF